MAIIALTHFRVGETDGVSLEMDKWKDALEAMGHEVFFISASESLGGEVVKGLDIRSPLHYDIVNNAYHHLIWSEDYLESSIQKLAKEIFDEFQIIIQNRHVDAIVVNNMSSLGYHLASGLAIHWLTKNTTIDWYFHHHDWYWERPKYSSPTIPYVESLLEECFPPRLGTHIVINKIAQTELKQRKLLDSTIVPNVFDFNQSSWIVDEYNESLRERIGVSNDDFVLLQATRIVERKGIEIAVDLTKRIAQAISQHVVLVIAGMNEMDDDRYRLLIDHIHTSGIDVRFISHLVSHQRDAENKVFSLWDVYTIADMVTYPSLLEGWGNQLIEALFAKKMVFIYEYPVYKTDLSSAGLRLISLGDTAEPRINGLYQIPDHSMDKAIHQFLKYFHAPDVLSDDVNWNFTIASNLFSTDRLSTILHQLFN